MINNLDRDVLTVALQTQLRDELYRQPWWKRISNTVTATVTGLLTLIYWVNAAEWEVPTWIKATMGVIVFIGGVIGIKATRNGLTESVAVKVAQPEVIEHALARAQGDVSGAVAQGRDFIDQTTAHVREQADEAVNQAAQEAAQWQEDVTGLVKARVAELAESVDPHFADARTAFIQLADGTRTRIQLLVRPEK